MKIEQCFGCQVYSLFLEYKKSADDQDIELANYCTLYKVYLFNDKICPCSTCIVKITCHPDIICPKLAKEKIQYNLP